MPEPNVPLLESGFGAKSEQFDYAIGPSTDIAIVEFGTNDLHLGVPAEHMRSNLNEIVRSLRVRRIEVLVIGYDSPSVWF